MGKKLFLLFIFISFPSFCQNLILKDLATPANYELYISASKRVVNENNEVFNDFIYDNQSVIQNIITTWQGTKTNDYLKCGYNYEVYIVIDNKVVETIAINDECNQLVYSKGAVNIKDNPFSKLNSDLKFSTFTFKAKSKSEALTFLDSLKNIKDVYCGNCINYDFDVSQEHDSDNDNYDLQIFGKVESIEKLNKLH